MKIAITSKFTSSFFSNGLNQNLVLLYECLEQCGFEVYFLDFTNKNNNEVLNEHFFLQNKNILNWWEFQDSTLKIDMLLCPGVSANSDIKKCLKLKNPFVKFVAVKYGNNLITDSHKFFLSKTPKYYSMDSDRKMDHVLYSPHYKFQSQYFEFTERAPSSEIPYIWDPKFIEFESNNLSIDPTFKPCEKPNIAVVEPNLNISKTSFIPFLSIVNLIEKKLSNKFNHAYIFSSKDNIDYTDLAKYLYKHTELKENRGKIFFDQREKVPMILSRDNPIILSHQFYNELNYVYLEAIYYNYPLVHNSDAFRDYGFYYNGFNIEDASNQLLAAVEKTKDWPSKAPHIGSHLIEKYSINQNKNKIKKILLDIKND